MRVIVVHLILTFFVISLMLVLVFGLGVLVAFRGGVLALWSVCRVWLEILVAAIRRSLVHLFLFALVVVATMTAVILILPFVVVTMILVALPDVATVTPLTLFCDMANFLVVLLTELMTHLASHVMLNLTLAFLCKGAVCYLQVENVLEVLCDRLKRLVPKMSPTLNILCTILRVEGHIEPLKL